MTGEYPPLTAPLLRRERIRAALAQKWHEDSWPYELRRYVRRLRRTRLVTA